MNQNAARVFAKLGPGDMFGEMMGGEEGEDFGGMGGGRGHHGAYSRDAGLYDM